MTNGSCLKWKNDFEKEWIILVSNFEKTVYMLYLNLLVSITRGTKFFIWTVNY